MTDRILTVRDALDLVPVSEKTLRNAYVSGELRAYQPVRHGRVLIRESDLLAWVESRSAMSA